MNKYVKLNSKSYQPIHWKNIFDQSAISVSESHETMGLVNLNGLVMMTESSLSQEKIKLCCENESIEIINNLLESHNKKLFDSDILFFELDHKIVSSLKSNSYVQFINKIVHDVFSASKTIFTYTHEHLSNRKFNDIAITQIETVKSQFVDIIVLFEQIEIMLHTDLNPIQLSFPISLLIQALQLLSKLMGARAVLKHNSIELLFYLKIFQKFIFDERRIYK